MAAHSLRWFTECGSAGGTGEPHSYVLQGIVWFGELRIERADGSRLPVERFAADGARWWKAFGEGDSRLSAQGQREAASAALRWRDWAASGSMIVPAARVGGLASQPCSPAKGGLAGGQPASSVPSGAADVPRQAFLSGRLEVQQWLVSSWGFPSMRTTRFGSRASGAACWAGIWPTIPQKASRSCQQRPRGSGSGSFRLRSRGPARTERHLHLTSTSVEDQQQTVARSLGLGARRIDVGQRPEEGHVVLADPEGNEFCVIEPGNKWLAGCGFLAELTCDGSREVGYFWSEALGWPLVLDQGLQTAIRSPQGGPKVSWDAERLLPKSVKTRLHLDARSSTMVTSKKSSTVSFRSGRLS